MVRQPASRELLRGWYQPLTPFVRAVGYGLFALTDDRPDQFQEVKARDILEVIEVAKHITSSGTEVYHGQHYRDAFNALERLFNVALPVKTKRIRKDGRYHVLERRIDFVRLLDGFGLVYLDPKTDMPLAIDGPDFEPYRLDIAGRRIRKRVRGDDDRPVWALVKVDSKTGEWIADGDGNPILMPPYRYRFRWGREVVADLLNEPEGRGWLNVNKAIFGVLRNLRRSNSGRGHPTAARLLDLIVSDILARGATRQRIEKPAKFIFAALGFPEPGGIKKGHLHKRDGRWSENVSRVVHAVQALKAEGVLLPHSDERPRVDPNPDRRGALYYRWIRAQEWTFTTAIEIVGGVDAKAGARSEVSLFQNDDAARYEPQQGNLFGNDGEQGLRGRDVRAARHAAGLTLRDLVKRFGKSIAFWSMVEREMVSKRTCRPRFVPPEIHERLAAFVTKHLGRKERRCA